ncbi:MAG: 50S ribosomal protein L21 [Nitrospira sp.]
MEFAIIATGGKQYKVSKGDVVKIEKIKGDLKVGDKVVFDKVLLVDDGKDATIGTPYITKASVEGTLKEIGRNKTVEVIKYKQKSRYFKKNGHRQPWFKVEISGIK